MSHSELPVRYAQHKWFPVLVLVAAAAWWLWRASYAQYQTLFHIVVPLFSVALISLWFLRFGGATRRLRQMIVGGVALVLAAFFIVFRPVYNGDMGVYRWRLRFASNADQKLPQLSSTGEAADWQTTPHDYPRFLGNGYWAEVKGIELETDWQSHPPQELWRREIGAGWSAFAIAGNYAVTQEQRGENELVTCYRVQTGEPVWTHADAPASIHRTPSAVSATSARAPRPRSSATESSRKAAPVSSIVSTPAPAELFGRTTLPAEFGATVTVWGKSGSPLVVDDMVLISVGAPTGGWEPGSPKSATGEAAASKLYNSSLVAFDMKTGAVRWSAGSRQAQLRFADRRHACRRAANYRRQRKLGHRPPRKRRQDTVGASVVQ